jgi:CheY-like chemotaxis protein
MPDDRGSSPPPAVKDEGRHFLAHMGHDLRSPMTNIIALSEALLDGVYGPAPEAHTETLRHIRENGQRMIAMITDLVDLARFDSGQSMLEPAVCEVMEPCRESVETARSMATGKRITLKSEWLPEAVTAMADARRLRQIASNLATAAVVASPATGQVHVRGEARKAEGRLCLIAMASRHPVPGPYPEPAAIEAFATAEALQRLRKLSAVAVSVLEKLAAQHGGTFNVAEREGVIAIVVSLPLAFSEATLPRGSVESVSTPPAPATPLILLADDEEIIRTITKDYLESTGYRVSCATNGAEALEILQKETPDLVILDMQMPVLDGLDALKRMRTSGDPRVANIPVISLSGMVTPGHRDLCMAAGANGCLAKPFGIKDLERAITEYLGKT